MDSDDGTEFVFLARWGKVRVTKFDLFRFRFFPRSYAKANFSSSLRLEGK